MSIATRRGVIVLGLLGGLNVGIGSAKGVVVASYVGPETFEQDFKGYVGSWNGASAVAIGPRWAISARHVGGYAGGILTVRGQTFTADRIIQNRAEDFELIHLTDDLPGWHPLAPSGGVAAGQRVVLGAMGFRAGKQLSDGYDWSGGTGEAWGANVADQVGSRIMTTFDDPSGPSAVPGEAAFVASDSGGGVFVEGRHGVLRLAAIATSSSSAFGRTRFGDVSFALNLDSYRGWITAIVQPGEPVASSMPPPGEGTYVPPRNAPGPGTAAIAVIGVAGAMGYRRRAVRGTR